MARIMVSNYLTAQEIGECLQNPSKHQAVFCFDTLQRVCATVQPVFAYLTLIVRSSENLDMQLQFSTMGKPRDHQHAVLGIPKVEHAGPAHRHRWQSTRVGTWGWVPSNRCFKSTG